AGIITVTGNVVPRLMHQMVAAGLAGDVKTAREINMKLMGLHKQLFCEANPIPVKWACARMGLIKDALRLPLTPLSPEYHGRLRAAMLEAGIDL
ncbi:MAG: dihydrodipicolinate synthase family protein, partial [Rhodocyclaceae bacterium]